MVRATPPARVVEEREALAASLRQARDGGAGTGDLLAAYHELQAKIRRLDPRYAELTDPPTLSLSEAQALIPQSAVVIEYLLARSGSHVWALTNGSVFHAALPRRQDIEAVARRMLRALRGRETERNPQRKAALDATYWREAAALSQLIVTPIEQQLEGRKVYVVPDGVLHVVPFAALPHARARWAARTPLIATNEIATLPSLSVLALLRERADRPLRRDTPIAVVADPIYETGDLRLSLSASLVVLSACESARGRETDGEGVIGLTRGFLLAGASRVISSQWKIRDDESTPQFMAWFYDALLRRSLSPSAALRDAQLRMWKSRDWSAPYFWAAFTLYGE